MSKVVPYNMPRARKTFWSTQNTLDDVFDTERFPLKRFRSFRFLLGQRSEEVAKRKAKRLFKRMLQMMLNDMLEKDATFVLPKHQSGVIKITDARVYREEARHWKSKSIMSGRVYGGVIVLHPIMFGSIGSRQYHWKMTTAARIRMMKLVAQGREWTSKDHHGIDR